MRRTGGAVCVELALEQAVDQRVDGERGDRRAPDAAPMVEPKAARAFDELLDAAAAAGR